MAEEEELVDYEEEEELAQEKQAKETAVAQAVAERDARAQAEAQSLRGEVARLRDEVLAAEEARGVSMDEKTAEARAALTKKVVAKVSATSAFQLTPRKKSMGVHRKKALKAVIKAMWREIAKETPSIPMYSARAARIEG